MAWIELHQTVTDHRKVLRLKQMLKIRPSHVVGHLCFLWLWALDNTRDGDLSGIPPGVIAQAADYNPRKAEAFVEALTAAGFLDRDEAGLRIHDWPDYGGRLQELRKKNAQRMRRIRAGERVQSTCAHVQDIHNTTPEDTTLPNTTELSSSGGGDDAGADAQVREFLLERGLLPEEYLGADQALLDACRTLTEQLFQRLAGRQPTQLDQARVFCAVTVCGDGGARVDGDRRDLLCYAFEQAAAAGRGGQWPYIEGVLGRLHRRGIRDLRAAEDFELERAGL